MYTISRGGDIMPISYDKLFELLKSKGYTTYKIRKENIMGQGTLTALRSGKGGLDHRTIEKLCRILECQPGDIMSYYPDCQVPQPEKSPE